MPRPGAPGLSPLCSPDAPPQVGLLRTWSLRLRHAGELQAELAHVLRGGPDQAGLVGPAGDALRELSRRLAAEAATAARAVLDAADELDRSMVRIMLGAAIGSGTLTGPAAR